MFLAKTLRTAKKGKTYLYPFVALAILSGFARNMKSDLSKQLAHLRRRVRRIEKTPPRPAFEHEAPALDTEHLERYDTATLLEGKVVESQWGGILSL